MWSKYSLCIKYSLQWLRVTCTRDVEFHDTVWNRYQQTFCTRGKKEHKGWLPCSRARSEKIIARHYGQECCEFSSESTDFLKLTMKFHSSLWPALYERLFIYKFILLNNDIEDVIGNAARLHSTKRVSYKLFFTLNKPGNSFCYNLCKVTRTSWTTEMWPHPATTVPLLMKTFNTFLFL